MLTTGWNPLAGATPDLIEEVMQTLGPEHDTHNPQSALEVGGWMDREFKTAAHSRLACGNNKFKSVPLFPSSPEGSERHLLRSCGFLHHW